MHWAVKKVSAQAEMMHNKSGAIVVKSKSSFLPEELERRISRGYCKGDRPSSVYIYILGRGLNPRTLSSPRTGKHCHKNPC